MDSPGNRRAITLNIYWKWCLSSLKGFVIPGRAEYEDFFTSLQLCCVVITNPCACKSQRDTDFPQTRNRGKASWSVRELKRPTGKCEFTNVQLNDILRDRFIYGLRAE